MERNEDGLDPAQSPVLLVKPGASTLGHVCVTDCMRRSECRVSLCIGNNSKIRDQTTGRLTRRALGTADLRLFEHSCKLCSAL